MNPHQHILLAVTGLSPQVVTETIYAIHKSGKPLPNKIVIITTQIGANEANKHLLENRKLQQLCEDYQLGNITLNKQDICIIPDEDGEILNDINAQKQMNVLADFICNKVQQLTSIDNNVIHASLAGGRKTMTFFLGMAMSLYGRKQDTLSHVLVSAGYESSDFFYPTPHSFNITNYRGTILDAKQANVVLTEIPFVRLRDDFPNKLLNGTAKYSETIDWLNFDATQESLLIETSKRSISYCQKECKLAPAEFIFYLWFCARAKLGQSGLSIPHDEVPNSTYRDEYLQYYSQHNDVFKLEEITNTLKNGISKDYFEQKKSRVNSAIKSVFGKRLSKNISINRTKQLNGKYQFAVTLAADLIKGEI